MIANCSVKHHFTRCLRMVFTDSTPSKGDYIQMRSATRRRGIPGDR